MEFAAKSRSSGRLPADGTQALPRPDAGKSGPSLSQILSQIASDQSRLRVSTGDLATALQDRAIGALIFVLAFPNIIPLPPGASTILGAPLVFVTAQLALGLRPWLPKLIADRSMDRVHFTVLLSRIVPRLARAERLLRPRLECWRGPPVEYL